MDETEAETLLYKINIKDYNEGNKGFLNKNIICYINDNENNIEDNLNNKIFINNDDNKYKLIKILPNKFFVENINFYKEVFKYPKVDRITEYPQNKTINVDDIYINSADFTDNDDFIKYKEFIENKSKHPEQGGKRKRRKTSKKIHKTKRTTGGRRRRHRTSKKHAK